jgi:hypothetical protein
MRTLRVVALAALTLSVVASTASAQRRVNTGSAPASKRAMEFGFDAASITAGMDSPNKYLDLAIAGDPMLRMAIFLSTAVAIEPRFRWFSSATQNQVGFSSYALDIGVLYGLSSMDPNEKPLYVRPSVMISGGSSGVRSYTTLSGAIGMRRMMHGMIMHNELSLNRQLESGPVAAATYLQLRHGLSFRRQ